MRCPFWAAAIRIRGAYFPGRRLHVMGRIEQPRDSLLALCPEYGHPGSPKLDRRQRRQKVARPLDHPLIHFRGKRHRDVRRLLLAREPFRRKVVEHLTDAVLFRVR